MGAVEKRIAIIIHAKYNVTKIGIIAFSKFVIINSNTSIFTNHCDSGPRYQLLHAFVKPRDHFGYFLGQNLPFLAMVLFRVPIRMIIGEKLQQQFLLHRLHPVVVFVVLLKGCLSALF